MNLLKDTRCYLAGPVEHDKKATSWRYDVALFLSGIGVKVYDPLKKPPWLDEICHLEPSIYRKAMGGESSITTEQVIEANHMMRVADLRIVHAVDWLICYLPLGFTAGTFEEVYEAIRVGKPVLFCCPDGIPSTWLLAAAATVDTYKECFFDGWDLLKRHVALIDSGGINLDPVKWIFLAWRSEDWNNPLGTPKWR